MIGTLNKEYPQDLHMNARMQLMESDASTCQIPHAVLNLRGYHETPDSNNNLVKAVTLIYEQPRMTLATKLRSPTGKPSTLSSQDWVRSCSHNLGCVTSHLVARICGLSSRHVSNFAWALAAGHALQFLVVPKASFLR